MANSFNSVNMLQVQCGRMMVKSCFDDVERNIYFFKRKIIVRSIWCRCNVCMYIMHEDFKLEYLFSKLCYCKGVGIEMNNCLLLSGYCIDPCSLKKNLVFDGWMISSVEKIDMQTKG